MQVSFLAFIKDEAFIKGMSLVDLSLIFWLAAIKGKKKVNEWMNETTE